MPAPRRPIMTMSRLLALLLLAATALLGAEPAGAHAMLLESDPADGAVLAQSPSMVVLRFDEPVTLRQGRDPGFHRQAGRRRHHRHG